MCSTCRGWFRRPPTMYERNDSSRKECPDSAMVTKKYPERHPPSLDKRFQGGHDYCRMHHRWAHDPKLAVQGLRLDLLRRPLQPFAAGLASTVCASVLVRPSRFWKTENAAHANAKHQQYNSSRWQQERWTTVAVHALLHHHQTTRAFGARAGRPAYFWQRRAARPEPGQAGPGLTWSRWTSSVCTYSLSCRSSLRLLDLASFAANSTLRRSSSKYCTPYTTMQVQRQRKRTWPVQQQRGKLKSGTGRIFLMVLFFFYYTTTEREVQKRNGKGGQGN